MVPRHRAPRSSWQSAEQIRTAWALLLDERATYGYELHRQLACSRRSIDGASIYRMLRQLERDEWVQSRWMRPHAGPRRRLHRITAEGRRNLDEIAGWIDDTATRTTASCVRTTARPKATRGRDRRRRALTLRDDEDYDHYYRGAIRVPRWLAVILEGPVAPQEHVVVVAS